MPMEKNQLATYATIAGLAYALSFGDALGQNYRRSGNEPINRYAGRILESNGNRVLIPPRRSLDGVEGLVLENNMPKFAKDGYIQCRNILLANSQDWSKLSPETQSVYGQFAPGILANYGLPLEDASVICTGIHTDETLKGLKRKFPPNNHQ